MLFLLGDREFATLHTMAISRHILLGYGYCNPYTDMFKLLTHPSSNESNKNDIAQKVFVLAVNSEKSNAKLSHPCSACLLPTVLYPCSDHLTYSATYFQQSCDEVQLFV